MLDLLLNRPNKVNLPYSSEKQMRHANLLPAFPSGQLVPGEKRTETVTYGILLRRDIKYQRLAKGNAPDGSVTPITVGQIQHSRILPPRRVDKRRVHTGFSSQLLRCK